VALNNVGRGPLSAEAAADAILAGERRGGRPADTTTVAATESTVRLLERATEASEPVRVAYVEADGAPGERLLTPLDVAAGVLRAVDRRGAQVVTIPLSRISRVRPEPRGQLD
jgi:hypothetical protein